MLYFFNPSVIWKFRKQPAGIVGTLLTDANSSSQSSFIAEC